MHHPSPRRHVSLNTWIPDASVIWEEYETVRRWSFSGGSETLKEGLEV